MFDEWLGYEIGEFVKLRINSWLGQVLNFRQTNFGEEEYELRVWTGSELYRAWFVESELVGDSAGDGETNEVKANTTAQVIDLAAARAKGVA